MTAEFAGLAAIVTGGASGIGHATALELRARGARVAVLDLDPSGLPDDVVGVVADVASRPSVEQAVATAAAALGGIDVVVNNAGVGATGTVADHGDDEWHRVLDINVVGMARVVSTALPWLRRSDAASVVNISSIAALNGLPDRALYSASKGAVLSLTLAMATDHVREGVRVNCVCPGTADTPWVGRLLARAEDPAAERAALRARQPIGRLVTPEEVANAIVYLASPRSGSTTGTVLDVDGGITHLRVRP
ncbi:SDR family NAD(P)-dependent oxidoreductase [Micromonospora sp. DH14]|uniref:SDR family NAD(P)-dependent oxidoreductase n=1 Tax=Micromonospora sp. DH14 TaxID=3040120 RepID=UPI002441BCCD|nr:SDR family NAD(P)-dependent oxidoreductase [Micromonospora sp. DH14]MDG9674169.1 SDR family NAD(P)-dependent oxidoreductase [Micromonospora sp. DH14]